MTKRQLGIEAAVSALLGLALCTLLNSCAGQKGIGYSKPVTIGAQSVKTGAQYAARLESKLDFVDVNGNQYLDAEEVDTLLIFVSNRGYGSTSGLRVNVQPPQPIPQVSILPPDQIPNLAPGDSGVIRVLFRAGENVPDTSISVEISLADDAGNVTEGNLVRIPTRRLIPPNLRIVEIGIDDDMEAPSMGNTNFSIEPGETIELSVILQNLGSGSANNLRTRLVSNSPYIAVFDTTTTRVGLLNPQQHELLKYAFTVFTAYTGSDTLPLALDVIEAHQKFSSTIPLKLVLNRREQRATELIIKGAELAAPIAGMAVPRLSSEVEKNIPTTSQKNKYAYAVVIGNKNYKSTYPVEFADRDATFMKRYFVSTFGVPEENVKDLRDASKAQLESVFGSETRLANSWLERMVLAGKSDVYIYYCGHGCPDPESGEAYFVPIDGTLSDISITGYRLQTLYDNLNKIPAKSYTIVIDACFSGQSPQGLLVQGVSPLTFKVKQPAYQLGDRGVIFTSSGPNEVSNWFKEGNHGLFTYYFMKGLQGSADKNSDGTITAAEMESYLTDPAEGVNRQARVMGMFEQNPQFIGNQGMVLYKP